MGYFRQIAAIIKKDIVSELRTKEMVTSMFLFAMLAMVIFYYAFGTGGTDLTPFGGGMLWTVFLFMSLLGLNRCFVHEKDEGLLEGLLLSPIDRTAIYFGKMFGNLIFLITVQAIALPAFLLFFIERGYFDHIGLLLLSIILGNVGISGVGTLLATISINTRTRDLLLPIIFLPVVIPLVIAAVLSTGGILAGAKDLGPVYSSLKFLAAYDIIFLLVAYGLYDFVIGE